jgi:ABC-2 family transporter protein
MSSVIGPLCRLQWRVLDKRRLAVWSSVFLATAAFGIYQEGKVASAEWSAQPAVAPPAARVAPRTDVRPSDLEWDWPAGEPSAATLEVSPLRATSRGQTGRLPAAYPSAALAPTMSNTWMLSPMAGVSESAAPAVFSEVVGRIDVTFVLVWLLPLVVIGLGYDLLSREAEDGTLALLLSQPVTGGHVLLAQCLVRLPWVLAMAVLVYLAAAMMHATDLAIRDATRLAAGCGLIAAYVLVWLSACALINTGRRSSAMNGLLLGALWFGLVALTPATVDLAVRAAAAHPDDAVADLRLRALREEHRVTRREGDTHDRINEVHLERFLEEHPEYMPLPQVPLVYHRSYDREINVLRTTLGEYARGFYLNRQLSALMGELDEKHRRRERLLDRLRFLSPATLLSDALDRIAGTNEGRYRAFHRQVREYVSQKAERVLPLVFSNQPVPANIRSMRFIFAEPSLASALGTACLGLVLPAVAMAVLAGRRGRAI